MTFKNFWTKFLWNLVRIFSGYNFLWHLLAMVLTYLIVTSGFDWTYFRFFYNSIIYKFLLLGGLIGTFVPVLVPLTVYIVGKVKKNLRVVNTALGLAQAAMMGSLVSSFYKALTGRAHPVGFGDTVVDITRVFQFGWMRAGIFWGWPSSHTAIAFAMSFALITMFPRNDKVKIYSLIYCFFVGIGVSMSFHWFSDFVAGAIIGTVIGVVVGKSFSSELIKTA